MIWWDSSIDFEWPNIPFEAAVFMTVALLIPPFFFFLYGFNSTNSLLRTNGKKDQIEARYKLVKKTIIFFVLAEMSEGIAGLVVSPNNLINYLLTWELFHLFSISTLFILIVFEISWFLELKLQQKPKQMGTIILLLTLFFLFSFFLIFHDPSNEKGVGGLYTNLDLNSILKRMIFEDGQNPTIPWIGFPLLGGFLALILDLPHDQDTNFSKKRGGVLVGGACLMIIGWIFLTQESYHSPPVHYPASSSFLFITMGVLIVLTTIMILLIDLPPRQTVIKIFSPIILISNISLTVFIVHNVVYAIPEDSQIVRDLLPSINIVMIVGVLYCILFIYIALIWKKWNYKYSIEWMIVKIQRTRWRGRK